MKRKLAAHFCPKQPNPFPTTLCEKKTDTLSLNMPSSSRKNKGRKSRKLHTKENRSKTQSRSQHGSLPVRPRRKPYGRQFFQIMFIAITIFAYKQYTKTTAYCKNPLHPLCPDKYFSRSYIEARDKFISLSSSIENANIYNLSIYNLSNDSYLYTDITIINENSTSDHLLIHLSGTHGLEGHAGSAIQLSLLEYISNITNNESTSKLFENYTFHKNLQCNADNTDNNDAPIIMLIHALNPYGFHFGRRVNENNVDLNRNYKTKKEWNELVEKDKNIFGYQALNQFFNPKYDLKWVAEISETLPCPYFFREICTAWYYWSFFINAAYHILSVGNSAIAASVVTGQWYNPKGIQYNGEPFKLEKSHEMLHDFIANRMFEEKHIEWKEQIKKISFIDVHTGLGKYGLDTLIARTNDDVNKLKVVMPSHNARDLIVESKNAMNDRYQNVNGWTFQHISSLIDSKLNGKNVDTLNVMQEFGTYDGIWVFAAMRMENGFTQSYNEYIEDNKGKNEWLSKNMEHMVYLARQRFSDTFYVKEIGWKRKIIMRGFYLFNQIFNR